MKVELKRMTIAELAKDDKDDNEGGVSDSGLLFRKLRGHVPADFGRFSNGVWFSGLMSFPHSTRSRIASCRH